MSEKLRRVVELTKLLIDLESKKDDVTRQLESLLNPISTTNGTPHSSLPAFLPAPISNQDVEIGGSGKPIVERPPMKKKGVGQSGFSGQVFLFMQEHPDREYTPEQVAEHLGEPHQKGLASTAMSRLAANGRLIRPRTGRYLYPSTPPINFSEEQS